MLKKTILTLIFLTVASSFVYANGNTIKIESLRGEKWWGIYVGDAPVEPFVKPFSIRTAQYGRNGFLNPLLVSSEGRYIWSETPLKIDFDGMNFTITSERGQVNVEKGGRNLREAYLVACHNHFRPTGEIPAMELFTMPIYDLRNEMSVMAHSQDKMLNYADRLIKEGFPAGVLLISDGWNGASGAYEFDKDNYPDPKAMIETLHSKGFKIMLTVTPYAPAAGKIYVENNEQGILMCDNIGMPMLVNNITGYYTIYDLSKTETADKIKESLRALKTQYGVDGFRFDCRTALPQINAKPDIAYKFMKNWVSLCESGMCEFSPGLNTPLTPYINCIESGYAYGWDLLKAKINDVLSAGLSGFSYCHISAADSDPEILYKDQNLMLRTLQLACFMPILNVPFAPWRITDDRQREQIKQALIFRTSMSEYITEMVSASAKTAEPLLRHMEYQFPRSGFADCEDQFMFGSKYLCAPIVGAENARMVRLPRGVWLDAKGKKYRGPLVTKADSSDGKMIYFELVTK